MKILSIDFDYLQEVTEEQLRSHYPDGVDNNTFVSEVVWASHYASDGDEINQIGIREDELEILETVLLNQPHDIPVMITNSHKHIYDFICEYDDGEEMVLVNADMHHDISNKNPELDCGNWISHLSSRQLGNGAGIDFTWVTNPVSLQMVDGLEKLLGEHKSEITKPSVKEYEGEAFDMVFLCRSDTWSPPHLDKYFTELCDVIKSNFDNIRMENGIDKPRKEYSSLAEQIKKATEKFREREKDV